MKVHTLIPSRMASTRLPNKPLVDIGGKPMILRVWEQAMKADLGPVTVAAGDQEIVDVMTAAGADAVMTDPDLPSGSDRIWAGLQQAMADGAEKPDIIINAQGDEPLLPPELLTQAVQVFAEQPGVDVVTFAHWISDVKELEDPGLVKAVTAPDGTALYFSRCSIPYQAAQMKRHVGFYAYKYAALEAFVAAEPSPLEKQEKLEQLRGLEMGLKYHVAMTESAPIGVDTAADLEKVRAMVA